MAFVDIKVTIWGLYPGPKVNPGTRWPRIKDLNLVVSYSKESLLPKVPQVLGQNSRPLHSGDTRRKLQSVLSSFSLKESRFFLSRNSLFLGVELSTSSREKPSLHTIGANFENAFFIP